MAISVSFLIRKEASIIIVFKKMVKNAATPPARFYVAEKTYEEAIHALNELQTNAATIELHRKDRSLLHRNIPLVKRSLERLGITPHDIDGLKIIHVAGTKGKGSTCAFAESMLCHHGFKTGFYSSPHLVAVRERIRINGQPLSKDAFASYFWNVYNILKMKLGDGESMPTYFSFLTVLAFYVFLQEKVDATVIEVGLGGQYDSTNVIQTPFAVGITSLSLDHVRVLGDTVEKIAWEKAGIFKSGISAFTIPQPDGAMKILQQRAQECKCSLHIAPPLEAYSYDMASLHLGVPGDVQKVNASLALQLVHTWLLNYQILELGRTCKETLQASLFHEANDHHELPPPLARSFQLTPEFIHGLQKCIWPGRFQTLQKDFITYYLDGAHNNESMEFCAKWFNEVTKKERLLHQGLVYRVLLFSSTGERKAENLLLPLSELQFDLAIFCPTRISVVKDSSPDQSNFTVDPAKEMQQCEANMQMWCHLISSSYEVTATGNSSERNSCTTDAVVFPSIANSLNWLSNNRDSSIAKFDESCRSYDILKKLNDVIHVQLLVTGSLHLVGGVLSLIDKDLKSHSS